MFKRLSELLLGLLFPDRCAGCRALGTLLCAQCTAALRPYPGGDRPIAALDGAQVAYVYAGALRPAIHQLKYKGGRRMAQPLGTLLATYASRAGPPTDALVPVPLHATRLAERGYNQSELLAAQVAAATGLPMVRSGLERVRATEQQAKMTSGTARQHNMRGAFVWRGPAPPPRRALLIDDVFTTGATLAACADALRAAGAHEIRALALARSRPPGSDT